MTNELYKILMNQYKVINENINMMILTEEKEELKECFERILHDLISVYIILIENKKFE